MAYLTGRQPITRSHEQQMRPAMGILRDVQQPKPVGDLTRFPVWGSVESFESDLQDEKVRLSITALPHTFGRERGGEG